MRTFIRIEVSPSARTSLADYAVKDICGPELAADIERIALRLYS